MGAITTGQQSPICIKELTRHATRGFLAALREDAASVSKSRMTLLLPRLETTLILSTITSGAQNRAVEEITNFYHRHHSG